MRFNRVKRGQAMPGVFEVNRPVPLSQAIDDLLLLYDASLPGEWDGQVWYLPLR